MGPRGGYGISHPLKADHVGRLDLGPAVVPWTSIVCYKVMVGATSAAAYIAARTLERTRVPEPVTIDLPTTFTAIPRGCA